MAQSKSTILASITAARLQRIERAIARERLRPLPNWLTLAELKKRRLRLKDRAMRLRAETARTRARTTRRRGDAIGRRTARPVHRQAGQAAAVACMAMASAGIIDTASAEPAAAIEPAFILEDPRAADPVAPLPVTLRTDAAEAERYSARPTSDFDQEDGARREWRAQTRKSSEPHPISVVIEEKWREFDAHQDADDFRAHR